MPGRFAEQRVVIRVVVAEDESPLPVRDVPGDHVNALGPRHLADNAPRHVDSMGKDRGLETHRPDQSPRRVRRKKRRFQVSAQHRLGGSFPLK